MLKLLLIVVTISSAFAGFYPARQLISEKKVKINNQEFLESCYSIKQDSYGRCHITGDSGDCRWVNQCFTSPIKKEKK